MSYVSKLKMKRRISSLIWIAFALQMNACFLEGLLPKGEGSISQAISGGLGKITSFFGGNDTLDIQRGALSLGTTLIAKQDAKLAALGVPLTERGKISAGAAKELSS